jgi:hypothetical protein
MAGDERTARVSLAVQVADDFAPRGRPLGEIAVTLQGQHRAPVVTPGGYRVFLELPAGPAVVDVRGRFYLDESRTVNVPLADRRNPLLTVTLTPRWSYPFPEGTTLVRGRVLDPDGSALGGAQVELAGAGRQTRTSEDGRFVLYITGLSEEEVTTSGGRLLVRASGGGTAFSLRVRQAGFQEATVAIPQIEAGSTLRLAEPVAVRRT